MVSLQNYVMHGRTKKGTPVAVTFNCDCGEYYCEIVNTPYKIYDYFFIHDNDCNINNDEEVKAYARKYVSEIEDY